jgi:hypothetical protein
MNLGNSGANSINQGIGSVFRTLAAAPVSRQHAEDQAALNAARVFAQNMSGQKHSAEADGLRYTNERRLAVPGQIESDPDMAPYMQAALKAFQNTGDTNMERYAKGASAFQQQQAISDIQGGMDPTRTGQAFAAVSGKMPFSSVGSTGRNINGLTGLGGIIESALAGNYDKKIQSETVENNAQAGAASASAGLSNERRKEIQQGKLSPGTDENGNPIMFRSGTNGQTTIIDDLTPYRKSGGAEAAEAKARARTVEKVWADVNVLPEEREAEIERRMALINPRAKSAGAPSQPATMKSSLPAGIPEGSKQVGTSKGKPVYQAPNGKRYIEG